MLITGFARMSVKHVKFVHIEVLCRCDGDSRDTLRRWRECVRVYCTEVSGAAATGREGEVIFSVRATCKFPSGGP